MSLQWDFPNACNLHHAGLLGCDKKILQSNFQHNTAPIIISIAPVKCFDTINNSLSQTSDCSIHLMVRGVYVLGILAEAKAPGILMAHGNIGTKLQDGPMSVFISRDGGWTWTQVSVSSSATGSVTWTTITFSMKPYSLRDMPTTNLSFCHVYNLQQHENKWT